MAICTCCCIGSVMLQKGCMKKVTGIRKATRIHAPTCALNPNAMLNPPANSHYAGKRNQNGRDWYSLGARIFNSHRRKMKESGVDKDGGIKNPACKH